MTKRRTKNGTKNGKQSKKNGKQSKKNGKQSKKNGTKNGTKQSNKRTKTISHINKKSKARGLFDYILGKKQEIDISPAHFAVLMQQFTDCNNDAHCNKILKDIIFILEKWKQILKKPNNYIIGHLLQTCKNAENEYTISNPELCKEKIFKYYLKLNTTSKEAFDEALEKELNIVDKDVANFKSYAQPLSLKLPISTRSSTRSSPRSSPRSNATSPRDNLWSDKSSISSNKSKSARLSDEIISLTSNTDTISVIILNANRIKCLLQTFQTKNYKKVTEQIYIVKLMFKEKVFYFILIDENIRSPDISEILVNYLFIADTFDYAKTQQITSHFDISNGNSVIVLPCAHNIGKYDGNCDAAAGKSVSNYKSKCNNWAGTDIDKKRECNIMNRSPIDWSLYKTAYNKVRTTTLLYKNKDVIKCRDTDLLTVALKYIVSPDLITDNLQNELVDNEDLIKMRQYHNTLFQFLEFYDKNILYDAPRNSKVSRVSIENTIAPPNTPRVSIENTIAPPNTPRNSREELEEFKSIKMSPQAEQ